MAKWGLGLLSALLLASVIGGFTTLYEIDKQQAILKSDLLHEQQTNTLVVDQLKELNSQFSKALQAEKSRVNSMEERLNILDVKVDAVDTRVANGFASIESQIKEAHP